MLNYKLTTLNLMTSFGDSLQKLGNLFLSKFGLHHNFNAKKNELDLHNHTRNALVKIF